MEGALQWISAHGCPAVFSLLAAGVAGVPLPDELLLGLTGSLAARGTLAFLPALVAAAGGALLGAGFDYALGRFAGARVLGWLAGRSPRVGAEAEKAARFLRRWGPWCLPPSFFVPGVRHLALILAGAGGVPPFVFLVFAGAGSLLWCGVFMTAGYAAWSQWRPVAEALRREELWVLGAGLAALALLVVRGLRGRWRRR